MKTLGIAVLVALSGCGPADWRPDVTNWIGCATPYFRAARVEGIRTCDALPPAITRAHDIATASAAIAPDEWRRLTAPVDLYVAATTNFGVPWEGPATGWTNCDLHFIEVGDPTLNALHEVFHLLDCAEGRGAATHEHPNWDAKGYYGLSTFYASALGGAAPAPTVEGSCTVSKITQAQRDGLVAAGFDLTDYDTQVAAVDAKCPTR